MATVQTLSAATPNTLPESKDVVVVQSQEVTDWPSQQGFTDFYEAKTPIDLQVTGKIPSYAAGTLLRTGPGGFQVTAKNGTELSKHHWFDGFACTHKFTLKPGNDSDEPLHVTYSSRRHVDEHLEEIRKSGKFIGFSFAQKRDPCQSFFHKVMSSFSTEVSSPNIGVTVSTNMPGLSPVPGKADVKHASGINTLFTKTDNSAMQQLDPETLEPIGVAYQEKLHPDLTGRMSGAHAKSDPITGDVFNYNLNMGMTTAYRVFRTSAATGNTDILATITSAPPAYLHSLLLTKDYVVLCIWNAHFAGRGLKILETRNMLDAISPPDPSQPAYWYVIDRTPQQRGVVATYTSPAFFCFHTVNAWQEGNDIIADLTAYNNTDVLKRFYYDNLLGKTSSASSIKQEDRDWRPDTSRASYRRYRLPEIPAAAKIGKTLVEAIVEFSTPADQAPELPTFNPRLATRPHRYTYGIIDRGMAAFVDGLCKFDAKTRTAIYWSEKGQSPGEAIFVPNPEAKLDTEDDEDNGVLLTVVLDGFRSTSYLLCLDPRTMTEIGRADVGHVVPFGFHGQHVSGYKPVQADQRAVDF